ncbi:MAG TPA: DUF2891 domain-containing protein [Fimbriimonas sp.]|nr:DUF2891 domain-containing protein [Fimbriimonas sp.]
MGQLQDLADSLADLPLNGIQREYPNHIVHLLNGPEDIKGPREMHPAFYGCFDWHSSVHGHWMLVRLLKDCRLAKEQHIREALGQNLSEANLQVEADYFKSPGRRSFERMYGWTWLLKLALELRTWDDPDAKSWAASLLPLEQVIVRGYKDFLPKQTYPIRLGTHGNTAFGLMFAYDYACAFDHELRDLIRSRALDYYLQDADYGIKSEPGGADFLSPALIEADLMRRILSAHEFKTWFENFLPNLQGADNLLQPALVSDRSDPQIAHLDGLNLSRAWCMNGIASALPNSHPYVEILTSSAGLHAQTGLANVASGHYEGEHWLASFAVHMLTT